MRYHVELFNFLYDILHLIWRLMSCDIYDLHDLTFQVQSINYPQIRGVGIYINSVVNREL